MKKLITGWIFGVVMALLALPALAADQPDPWAETAVTYCVEHGILDAGELRPKEAATRAELASMVVQLFLLVFLVSFRKYSLRRTPKGGTEHPVARHSAKRFKVS